MSCCAGTAGQGKVLRGRTHLLARISDSLVILREQNQVWDAIEGDRLGSRQTFLRMHEECLSCLHTHMETADSSEQAHTCPI